MESTLPCGGGSHCEVSMLIRRSVQFAVNACGTILLLFTLATMGLLLIMVAILRHPH